MTDPWLKIVGVTMSVFAVIGVGALARRVRWLSEEADRSLLKLGIDLLLPCLIFTVVAENQALRQAGNLLLSPGVGFGTMVLGLAAAMLVARLGSRVTGLSGTAGRRTFALSVGIHNYGFLPLPLVRQMFSDETLGVLFVHNVGAGLALWTLGVAIVSGTLDRRAWRKMINPPSVAVVVAVAFNLLDVTPLLHQYADFLMTAIKWLGEAAVPMLLILVGATIADQLRSGDRLPNRVESAKVILWSCLLRLGLLPAAFLLVAMLIPASQELRSVIVIEAAMPSAVFAVLLARHYGGHPGTALRVVLSTSILSLVTIPLWILAGAALFGLTPFSRSVGETDNAHSAIHSPSDVFSVDERAAAARGGDHDEPERGDKDKHQGHQEPRDGSSAPLAAPFGPTIQCPRSRHYVQVRSFSSCYDESRQGSVSCANHARLGGLSVLPPPRGNAAARSFHRTVDR